MKSFPPNFLHLKLPNKWASVDLCWWSHSYTIALNCSPIDAYTLYSSVSDNYCLVWFTLIQPGGIIVVLNAVDTDRFHFWTVKGSNDREGYDGVHAHTSRWSFSTNMQAHTQTKSATFHIEMIVSCICQVVLFFSSHGDLILGNWAISDWKQCR